MAKIDELKLGHEDLPHIDLDSNYWEKRAKKAEAQLRETEDRLEKIESVLDCLPVDIEDMIGDS